jgi:ketosteroid isomerase-like protein
MRRILAAAVVLAVVAPSALGQAAGPDTGLHDKTIEEVKKAAGALGQAVSRRDEATLKRLLADDYIFTHSTGDVEDKAQRIARIMENKLPTIESSSRDDVKYRVYGDTVVITSRTSQKSELNGISRGIQLRGIVVWVKQQGQWRLVAQQSTRIQSQRTATTLDPKVLDPYVGEYELAPSRRYIITREGSVLVARGGEREFILLPESEMRFFVEGMDAQWTFYKDDRGAVSEVGIRIGTGREIRAKKVK